MKKTIKEPETIADYVMQEYGTTESCKNRILQLRSSIEQIENSKRPIYHDLKKTQAILSMTMRQEAAKKGFVKGANIIFTRKKCIHKGKINIIWTDEDSLELVCNIWPNPPISTLFNTVKISECKLLKPTKNK